MQKKWLKIGTGIVCCLSLISCSELGMSDLRAYVRRVENRPGGEIEPLPVIKPYRPFTYTAFDLRNPFDLPELLPLPGGPDYARKREPLEEFALDALKMVGSIGRPDNLWALIKDPGNIVHTVKIGQYLGKRHGQVDKIEEDKVVILENVSDGRGGWKKSPTVMNLEE